MVLSSFQVREIFNFLSHPKPEERGVFFESVADDVNWTIMGDSPMSRVYNSKEEFRKATLQVLSDKVLTEPLAMTVRDVVASKDEHSQGTKAVVELQAKDAKCKNGRDYTMNYCWVCKFDEKDKIVQVRAYLDTNLLTKAIEENK